MRSTAGLAALSALVFSAIPARAADLLMTGEPRLDPPTLITLGVVLPIQAVRAQPSRGFCGSDIASPKVVL